MDFLQASAESWAWANNHPYLFTVIKLGQPSVWAVIIYAGIRIVNTFVKRGV